MSLVSDDEVKALIDTQRDTRPFIATAHIVVSEQLIGKGLSDDRLKQIELYLAAHYTAVSEEHGALKSSKMGESTDVYDLNVGEGLKLTRFGQQALSLDTSGTLRSMGRTGANAQFRIL
jgi:hypothetical protein